MRTFLIGLKNVLLWSYERGSWQYDVLCLMIVTVIFLVPSHYFGDRDRLPMVQANESRSNTSDSVAIDETILEIEADELQTFLKSNNKFELMDLPQESLRLYLRNRLKRDVLIIKYEQVVNNQGKIGYRVRFK